MEWTLLLSFALFRILIICAALALSYLAITRVVEPYVLRPVCLTDTNSCAYLVIWKYKNSFFAQVFPSGIYVWFNGSRIYVYGQAIQSTCIDPANYEPVYPIAISGTDQSPIYTRMNFECVVRATAVQSYYQSVLKVEPQTIYIRGTDPNGVQTANLNVFEVVQALMDLGYVSASKAGKQ